PRLRASSKGRDLGGDTERSSRRPSHLRGRLRDPDLRASHPAFRRSRVGSDYGSSAFGAMVPDRGPPRPAPRGDDRLPQRSEPPPCDGQDPRVGTPAAVRARMECRAPQGPAEGGAEHRPVGAHFRRRHDPPTLQPPPPPPPDRSFLRGRPARLPQSARGSTRGTSPWKLARPRG